MSYVSKAAGALHLALIKVMRGEICPACGNDKEHKKPFCKSCYHAVQKPLRNLLFTTLDAGDGEFEDHYMTALKDLKRRGLTRPVNEWSPRARRIVDETGLITALIDLRAAKQKSTTETRRRRAR